MLTKRIIPCLDIKDFRTVKGVNFSNLKDAGDAIELADYYRRNGADELVFLDIAATQEQRKTFGDFVEKVGLQLDIPFTVGGGIVSVEDMKRMFDAGADKVSINSAAVKNPTLIKQGAEVFGSQAIVIAIDAKKVSDSKWHVFISGGKIDTQIDLLDWIKQVQILGAGEILLTSMDQDGVKKGFDEEMLQAVKPCVKVPLIASGGAGRVDHFQSIFESDLADAGLAASIFHFGEIEIPRLKAELASAGIPIRI